MPTIESARYWYSISDPVHGFDHVLRVYHLAEQLAQAEGADLEIVRAAALLHDANSDQPSMTNHERANHHHASSDFASKVLQAEGWDFARIAEVQHCIRAHRFRDNREPPHTLEARILFDADKLDAIGAVGVARAIGYALQAGQPPYAPPSRQFLETGQLTQGEPHSAYHEYLFKLRHLKDRLYTPTAKRIAEERHRIMADFFERLAAEVGGM